ncbi:MAG: hypothetical protein IPH66_10165 [Crocinitomicaceae bacterium]|nr:hypothetical protein [Crocinitomicaceae bacterium]
MKTQDQIGQEPAADDSKNEVKAKPVKKPRAKKTTVKKKSSASPAKKKTTASPKKKTVKKSAVKKKKVTAKPVEKLKPTGKSKRIQTIKSRLIRQTKRLKRN